MLAGMQALQRIVFHFRWPGFGLLGFLLDGWAAAALVVAWLVVAFRAPTLGRFALIAEACVLQCILWLGAAEVGLAVTATFVLAVCHIACVGAAAAAWGGGAMLLAGVGVMPGMGELLLAGYVSALALVAHRRYRQLWFGVAAYLPDGVRAAGAQPTLRQAWYSVVFVDLVGFTRLCRVADVGTLASVVGGFVDAVVDVARACGGDVCKIMGDGALICFEASSAQERPRAARAAAACCLALGGRLPGAVRAGIASGRCLQGDWGSGSRRDHTVIGTPANLAARLQEAAGPDVPLACAATARLLHLTAGQRRLELAGFGSTAAFEVRC
jgi:class 3 adenylate cyclase